MILKIVRRGKTEIIDDATLLIVEDAKGDPVSVAAKCGVGDGFVVSCLDDEDRFNRVLRNLGIDKIVVKVPIDSQLISPDRMPHVNNQLRQ